MNDPHVVALTYRVEHSETVDFKQAPPLTVDRGIFRVTIDAGKATIEMIDHFDSVQAARAVVDPFLREWELAADLKHPEERFRFVYERSNVIDQSPSTSGARIQVPTAHIIMTGFDVVMHVGRRQWPEPPVGIALSPDVETLRRRWLGYVLEKEEKLLAAAYWALSMIEAAPGPSTASSGPRMTKRREAEANERQAVK